MKSRMVLAFFVVIITTAAVGAVGIVSLILLGQLRDDMLARGAAAKEIVFASHQHILLTGAIIGGVLLLCIILSIVFVARISRSIRLPIEKILHVVEQVGSTGDYAFSEDVGQSLRDECEYDDEMGRFSQSFVKMMRDTIAKAEVLEAAATGDLTRFAPAASEHDTLANATNTLIESLRTVTGEVRASVGQMNAGIAQISQGAQSLAQSTKEQSMTMSRLMDTLGELSSQAAENAEHSRRASEITKSIQDSADDGRMSMDKMMHAMEEISDASQAISTVMKAIDSIAFQTNILSLNAAVEAARAGQHGRGFAVVADEVRNLAAKSADAAKNSAELVEDTKSKSGMGSEIVNDTSAYFDKIMGGVSKSTTLLENISTATAEQNNSIEAINKGFEQLTVAMHQNSATAGESAAATEEMNSQADVLLSLVSHFKTCDGELDISYGHDGGGVEGIGDEAIGVFDELVAAPSAEVPFPDGLQTEAEANGEACVDNEPKY
ncbi:MAG: methyl-accepting chemotaxis protein [Clostridiales Family XIII bacterium]|nr:methyl-accepting chemotaxis protein [Clostridiales Family XIII bacterium]